MSEPDLSAVEIRRRWCFEKASQLREQLDMPYDIIYKAAEIETYLQNGCNPRLDFMTSVDIALEAVRSVEIPGVSDASKKKVMAEVINRLKEYKVV